MLPTGDQIRQTQILETEYHLKEATEKLADLKAKIASASTKNDGKAKGESTDVKGSNDKDVWDWTKSYKDWSQWSDLDELQQRAKSEQAKLDRLAEKQDLFTHMHDHSEERAFFELPEDKKMETCENHRLEGNYLFHQGSYSLAAESYRLAIGYYEYCFPEKEDEQKALDNVRWSCLCNLSLCYLRIGLYREAASVASQALRESKETFHKAYFRRAQAYRYLDEYDKAMKDLQKALEYFPSDAVIIAEMKIVQRLINGYQHLSTSFASTALSDQTTNGDQDTTGSKINIENEARINIEKEMASWITAFETDIPLEPVLPNFLQEFHLELAFSRP